MVIKRSRRKKFGNVDIVVCSLEDLIIYKLVAVRYKDLADIEDLISMHTTHLDLEYLLQTAELFKDVDREDVILNLKKFLRTQP